MAATCLSVTLYTGTLLIITCTVALGEHPSSFLSSYEIIVPQRVTRLRRDASGSLSEGLSYVIQADGKEHILHLEQNRNLLAKDFTVYTYAENGTRLASQIQDKDPCIYHGYAEGDPESRVAVSTCSGLRGLLHLQNGSYGIEPLQSSSKSHHLIYRLENVKKEPVVCGVSSPEVGHAREHQHSPSMTQLLRRKRAIVSRTRYVELFLVVDKERYDMLGNVTAVRSEMVQLSNYLDSMYKMLNIRIVLVGLEIWTAGNKISIEGSAGDVLGNFVRWRETNLVPLRRHDSAQFVLKKGFGGTAGMAFVGTVCSRSHAGGINVFSNQHLQSFASIVAHELGHNLGMNHDDSRSCTCPVGTCIMSSGASGSKNFSSCSEDDFEKLTLNKGGSCLLNVPNPDEEYSAPSCGNKLVDPGEECDCGNRKECEKDPCCEYGTCKLRSGSECAYGSCCQSCRFSPGGTVCRGVANECDLPEYCNGSSPFCQPDVFIQNGSPCQNNKAYCYNGICQYHDAQCQNIFGLKAKAAAPVCFREVNEKGDRFGNCGFQNNKYNPCEAKNAKCGKLQCEDVTSMPSFGIRPSMSHTPITVGNASFVCYGVDFQLGSDVPDPAMVNEGTTCDKGKVCQNYQCISASVLKYDCDVQMKCGGNGVCNSNKNCHCNEGWAFPDCKVKGYGGSVDSGPSYNDKDTSLRDGMLVFFLLVVPVLALGTFIFFRRNDLKRRFCRKKRSQAADVGKIRQDGRQPPRNAPSKGGSAASPLRNTPITSPDWDDPETSPPRNVPRGPTARIPPTSRPQRNLQNVPPGGRPPANAPPRNVPPVGPSRNMHPSTHEPSYKQSNSAVPTYMVKQPHHTPSRPPPPHQREITPNNAPSRLPPAPPV
ncbi:disintegrin and metalloproteinase domain-containing protein 9 [Pseudophryne corroboree]|uniref:disintegrin and metalloproteinase domain-containing protein 9 n=1 Tax=Pseudophryne corroboree TaxID=495146 RepID=UPI00308129C9